MEQQIHNFGRFYTALRALGNLMDRDEMKKSIVYQYTNGRTDSLREMTRAEYDRCCDELERRTGQKEELRKERSATLKLMQKLGVDTTDWNRINGLCLDRRIMGKEFARITIDEHQALRTKLRMIDRKGGFSTKVPKIHDLKKTEPKKQVIILTPSPMGEA